MSIRLLALLFAITALPLHARILLNEVHINPPGAADQSHQYVEILTVNDAGVPEAQTLPNIQIVFVDSNGGAVGTVSEFVNVNGRQTGSNGLLLVGLNFDQSVPWTIATETKTANFAALEGAGGDGDHASFGRQR